MYGPLLVMQYIFFSCRGNVVNDLTSSSTALMMVRQYRERGYTVEAIARELGTTVKRVTALIHEVERQDQEKESH